MEKKKIVIANWKMNKSLAETKVFADELRPFIQNHKNTCDVVICPPFPYLIALKDMVNHTDILIGAQNVYSEDKGAYTGEISCSMLKDSGCDYVIIGHSERRQYFDETNEIINKKVLKALDAGLIPILCVGETLQEHQDKITEAVIEEQVSSCLANVSKFNVTKIIIAYEPVWAIGTGKNATPHQAESVHNYIRRKIKKLYSEEDSKLIRIVYGGSINTVNAKELFGLETINGGLVGGASLEPASFIELIKTAS